MVDENVFEFRDDELSEVSGGASYSNDQRQMGDRMEIPKCACCGRSPSSGIIARIRPKGLVLQLDVIMDCCKGVGTYHLLI